MKVDGVAQLRVGQIADAERQIAEYVAWKRQGGKP
jgi:hypothetical protein